MNKIAILGIVGALLTLSAGIAAADPYFPGGPNPNALRDRAVQQQFEASRLAREGRYGAADRLDARAAREDAAANRIQRRDFDHGRFNATRDDRFQAAQDRRRADALADQGRVGAADRLDQRANQLDRDAYPGQPGYGY